MRLILIDWTIGTIREPQTQKIHAGRENSVLRRLFDAGEHMGKKQTDADDDKTQDRKQIR